MITKSLKPCPFCGGKVEIQIRDAEGNLGDEEYEKDPWSGLTYSIGHYTGGNPNCPIATYKEDIVGVYLYESKNEAIETWNRRIKLIENEKGESISEEKYKEALEMIGDCELDLESDGNPKLIKDFYHDEYKTLENLIKEYFKLVKIHKKLIEEYFNPQPYKFEELYKNMYVWVHWFKEDPTKGHPVRIEGTGYNDKGEQVVYYVWNDSSGTYAFDAFIFYPLTIALKIPKPIELTRFERDFLSAYYFEGTNIPNSRLMDHDFFIDLKTRGYYKNVDMKMTVREVLDRAVVKDAK